MRDRDLDLDLGQAGAQFRQPGGEELCHDLADRDPDRALDPVGDAGLASLHRFGGALHLLGQGQQRRAGGRRHEALGQAVEKPGGERSLQGAQAPASGRLGDLEPTRRGGQRAFARHGQENAQIVPVERHGPTLRSKRICLEVMRKRKSRNIFL